MRSNINFKLVCTECGSELEASDNKAYTKFTYPSAFDISAQIAIKPCEGCLEKKLKPAKLLKEAFAMLHNNSL